MVPHEQPPRLTIPPSSGFVPLPNEEIEQSIPRRFAAQVGLHAARLAIKTEDEELTFAELNRSANRIARAVLSRRGTGSEPIALLFDHGARSRRWVGPRRHRADLSAPAPPAPQRLGVADRTAPLGGEILACRRFACEPIAARSRLTACGNGESASFPRVGAGRIVAAHRLF